MKKYIKVIKLNGGEIDYESKNRITIVRDEIEDKVFTRIDIALNSKDGPFGARQYSYLNGQEVDMGVELCGDEISMITLIARDKFKKRGSVFNIGKGDKKGK